MRHNRSWLTIFGRARLFQRRNHLLEVVPVELSRAPAECAKFLRYRRRIENIFHKSIQLLPIVVHDAGEIRHFMKTSKHGCFPDLPFFNFTIADHYKRVIVAPVELCSNRGSDSDRQALPQRARRGLENRQHALIGMSLQR